MGEYFETRDLYSDLPAYFREQLRSITQSPTLARALEDDPEVDEDYKMILNEPGMGYNFEVSSF